MPSQGPNSPGTVIDAGGGTGTWTNPGNATSSNNVKARMDSGHVESSYLKATNFGFSIPSGATIDGIVVGIERSASFGTIFVGDKTVKMVKAGTISGTNKATATVYPLGDTYEDHGSNSDLWGLTWTDSDINDTNFGVALTIQNNPFKGGTYVDVDHIRITVYYTAGGGGGGSQSALLTVSD